MALWSRLLLLSQGDGPKDMFWELMEKFSHEERGLVLKFATGRIRYAVPLFVFMLSWTTIELDNQ